jgi:hypothetical protein
LVTISRLTFSIDRPPGHFLKNSVKSDPAGTSSRAL